MSLNINSNHLRNLIESSVNDERNRWECLVRDILPLLGRPIMHQKMNKWEFVFVKDEVETISVDDGCVPNCPGCALSNSILGIKIRINQLLAGQ